MIHNFNHVKIEALVGISGTREIDVLDFSIILMSEKLREWFLL